METQEHTPGAMRAADIIVKRFEGAASISLVRVTGQERGAALLAEIIDRETSLPELVDACEDYLKSCSCRSGGWDGAGVCSQPCDRCDKARAALKKAERTTP